MSTISVKFKRLPNGPSNRGVVRFNFNDGTQDIPLELELTGLVSINGTFSLTPYEDGFSGEDQLQAINYRAAFYRDYRDIGGSNNLAPLNSGDTVTISAENGTFNTPEYTGDVLQVSFNINNSTQVTLPTFTVEPTGVGSCTFVQYALTATDGSPPFRLVVNNATLNANWDGSQMLQAFDRGVINKIELKEPVPSNVTLRKTTIIVPRKLKIGEFKTRTTQKIGASDILIENINPVTGTEPIEYSLDDQNEVTGQDYKSSSSFPGVLPGQYKLFVKDKYGCEISKIIDVRALEDVTSIENPNFFLMPEGNSLIFSEKTEFTGSKRKNYFNTTSRDERTVGKRHQIVQSFFEDHEIATRFLSSFPYHIVTLKKCDGTKKDIPVKTVQTNLGAKEKIDCKFFNVNGEIGVYFDGGNEYIPDTTTVSGPSDFNGSPPDWAVIGQLVEFETLGAKYIVGEGFDETRGDYFTVEGSTTDDAEGKVQVIYNKHIYNVFDFFFGMVEIDKEACLEIQYGFDFDNIVGTQVSEVIRKVPYSDEWHLVKWGDDKNKGDMIYQSFPRPFILLKGKMNMLNPTESDTSRGDSKTYSLNQDSFLGFSFRAAGLTQKLANKLSIASGTSLFEIDDIMLVRNNEVTVEDFGTTNLKIWSGEFGYGGNQLGIRSDELVLDVSTGVVGGGSTAKGGNVPELGDPIVFDGKTRYIDSDGRFVVIEGNFVSTA